MRLGPYIFGMIAALSYQTNHDNDLLSKTPLWKEWLAFLTVIFIGFSDVDPFALDKSVPRLIYISTFRTIYGGCLSYLILLMISPIPSEAMRWSRPTKYIRGFLSFFLWLPIANLSYSMYLWHLYLMYDYSTATL